MAMRISHRRTDSLITNSNTFSTKFQLEKKKRSNCIEEILRETQLSKDDISTFALNTHPILSVQVKNFTTRFLELKKTWGTPNEKRVYRPFRTDDTGSDSLIRRLLTQRPVVFFHRDGKYVFHEQDNPTIIQDFDNIIERGNISKYMSFDEMAIASLISMSVHTPFINAGGRGNKAIRDMNASNFSDRGHYVSCVGALFETPGVMEWQHMVITERQNTRHNGYGSVKLVIEDDASTEYVYEGKRALLTLWAELYGMKYFPLFVEIQALEASNITEFHASYLKLSDSQYFHWRVYVKRMKFTIGPFLMEANRLAEESEKKAFVVAVGLGLGGWMIAKQQSALMVRAYQEILEEFEFKFISDLTFNWFEDVTSCGGVGDGRHCSSILNSHIMIHFNCNDPLVRVHDSQILVAQHSGDFNR